MDQLRTKIAGALGQWAIGFLKQNNKTVNAISLEQCCKWVCKMALTDPKWPYATSAWRDINGGHVSRGELRAYAGMEGVRCAKDPAEAKRIAANLNSEAAMTRKFQSVEPKKSKALSDFSYSESAVLSEKEKIDLIHEACTLFLGKSKEEWKKFMEELAASHPSHAGMATCGERLIKAYPGIAKVGISTLVPAGRKPSPQTIKLAAFKVAQVARPQLLKIFGYTKGTGGGSKTEAKSLEEQLAKIGMSDEDILKMISEDTTPRKRAPAGPTATQTSDTGAGFGDAEASEGAHAPAAAGGSFENEEELEAGEEEFEFSAPSAVGETEVNPDDSSAAFLDTLQ